MKKIITGVLTALVFSQVWALDMSLDPNSHAELSREYKVGDWDMVILEDKMGGEPSLSMQVNSVEPFIGGQPKAIFGFSCDKNISSMVILNEFLSLKIDGKEEDSSYPFQRGLIRIDDKESKEFQFKISEMSQSEKLLIFGIWDIDFEDKFYTAERVRIGYSTVKNKRSVVTFMTGGFEKAFVECVNFHENR